MEEESRRLGHLPHPSPWHNGDFEPFLIESGIVVFGKVLCIYIGCLTVRCDVSGAGLVGGMSTSGFTSADYWREPGSWVFCRDHVEQDRGSCEVRLPV